jgi:hypothetical protein
MWNSDDILSVIQTKAYPEVSIVAVPFGRDG